MDESPDGKRPFRVLVVEDDKAQLRTLCDILEDEGFEPIGCATANEALNHLDGGQIDVAVVDLRLPDLSETALLERLGAFSEHIPIIIHTGHSSYESAKEAINWGVFAYVEKAGDPAELLRQVHRAIQRRLVQRAEELEAAVAERTGELRKADAGLKESEERFRSLFENAPLGYQSLDANGDFMEVNETWCSLLGYTKEEVLSRNFSEFIHPDFREVFKENFPKFKSMGYILGVEFEMVKKDGSEIVVSFDGKIGHKDDGSFKQTHCVLKDITERKQAEDALRESESLMRETQAIAHVGSYSRCLQTGRVEWSEEHFRIFGYEPGEVKPTFELVRDHIHPEDRSRFFAAHEALLEKDEPYDMVYRIRRKDGTERIVNSRSTFERDRAGKPVRQVGAILDITDHKQLEEQLQHARKMEAVGQLAAGVAHEFNNLLFGILGSADLILATHEGKVPELLDRPLQDIKKCGQRGAALTKQLLSFARKKTPEVSLFDINQVVGELESVLRQVGGGLMTLELDLAADLPPIEADRGEIEQAIMNLASNARDAMPDGGTLTIQTATEQLDEARLSGYPHAQPGPYVQLSAADTGCGMTPETVERVFEPFFTTKPVGKGTGLGLSTAFADVTRSGGTIEVDSRQGEGTVFRIFLPAAVEKSIPASEDAKPSADRCPGGSETILVVDDDEVVLDSAAFLLETQGYSVIQALGGREALEAAESHDGQIELLLTDVTMPEMNGWELAQKLAEQRSDMKVIFMSGYAEDVLRAGAAKGERIEFLEKPPKTDTLFRRIREVLDATSRSAP